MEKPETWKILSSLAGCLVLFGFLAMKGEGYTTGNIVGGCLIGAGMTLALSAFSLRRAKKK
jgi:hypothetical protein